MSAAEAKPTGPSIQAPKSDEVLDLLDQASTLTDAIAADLEEPTPDPTSTAREDEPAQSEEDTPPQTAPPAAGPRLNDLLTDPDQGPTDSAKIGPATIGDAVIAPDMPADLRAPAPPRDRQGASKLVAAPAPEPSPPHRPTLGPTKTVSDLEATLEATPPAAGSEAGPPVEPKADSPARRMTFGSFSRTILLVPQACARAMGQVVVTILELLDRPFSGLSPETRRLAGLVAFGTLLMAAAIWIVPELLDDNPFEHLETTK